MKKKFYIALLGIIILPLATIKAQDETAIPLAGFNYQAVAINVNDTESFGVDSNGEILVNQAINVRFSIMEESETGPIVYQESHATQTDIFGMFRLVVGRGEQTIGGYLHELSWGVVAYFLMVEIDLGSGYQLMGVEELLGAPYALGASKQLLQLDEDKLSISDGNEVILSDNKPDNELITSVRLVGTELEITEANHVFRVDVADVIGDDALTTDEIQDLQLEGNILTITKNDTPTQIDLSVYLDDTNTQLSEEEVDAFTNNNGYLTSEVDGSVSNEIQDISSNGNAGNISLSDGSTLNLNVNDADADITNEIQDLNLNNNTLTITNNAAATNIDLTPYLEDTQLTEAEVDAMVSNNGYLTAEVDGSVTNEIQDLNLTGNTLTITNNAAATNIDLSPFQSVFSTTSGVTSNENGDYANDDFVFGSPQLGDDGNSDHYNRIFFDKSKAAFRAGRASNSWNDANVGLGSVALGINSIASGDLSTALGGSSASGHGSVALAAGSSIGSFSLAGNGGTASGEYSAALVHGVAQGSSSFAVGGNASATGQSSQALGHGATAINSYSMSFGRDANSSGISATAVGAYSMASGLESIAVGGEASNSYSTSVGVASNAAGERSTAIGGGLTNSDYGVAIGVSAATGQRSVAIGYNAIAQGFQSQAIGAGSATSDYSLALFGNATGFSSTTIRGTASGSNSFSIWGQASGQSSLAIRGIASGISAISIGGTAAGPGSYAIGGNTSVYGTSGIGLGINVISRDDNETVFGMFNVDDLTNDIGVTSNLITIGNGTTTNTRSNALVMLKNGNTTLHGNLTIDADNVNGAGTPYTLPGQDGTANQTMLTDGAGNVSWANGDNSETNEIQDLNLTGNTLTITNNAAATNIDLSPFQPVFSTTSGVTSNENGDYANDDFLFGSPQLADDGNPDHDTRMFFDKSKGAFRAGGVIGNQWDDANVGSGSFGFGNAIASGNSSFAVQGTASATASFAFGYGSVANGYSSISLGQNSQTLDNFDVAIGQSATASGGNAVAMGNASLASGGNSLALGTSSTSASQYTVAIGRLSVASAVEAMAIGIEATSSGFRSFALGAFVNAEGYGSVAIGGTSTVNGNTAVGLGHGLTAPSRGEVVLGSYNTQYIPVSSVNFEPLDRLFVIGNGTANGVAQRSDALVMLKNGHTTLHGNLTIDADNVNGAGTPYTLPGQDGNANQTMLTDGAGNVTWVNGDNSETNEIQDLNLTGNTLTITNNAAATNIDLEPYVNVFETTSGVTSNENGDYATDDFVFGSPQLADDGNTNHDARMFFDKSLGAFRAGRVINDFWNVSNRGNGSIGLGTNVIASGTSSISIGYYSSATGQEAVALGYDGVASGTRSISLGNGTASGSHSLAFNATASGQESMAFFAGNASGYRSISIGGGGGASGNHSISFHSNATGTGAISFAMNGIAQGNYSVTHGYFSIARSYGETALGFWNTDSPPSSINSRVDGDKLFSIGNGTIFTRSDALVMLKNGHTTLHGNLTIDADNVGGADGYTLPGQDGFAGQLLVTDGVGQASWTNDLQGNYSMTDLNIFNDLTVGGTIFNPSDSRWKQNINPIDKGLENITKLQGVQYNWNSHKNADTLSLQTGLIAQELEKVLPELVSTDANGYKSVNYMGLIPHLIEAVKALKEENEVLKERQSQFNTHQQGLEQKLMRLEKLIGEIIESK